MLPTELNEISINDIAGGYLWTYYVSCSFILEKFSLEIVMNDSDDLFIFLSTSQTHHLEI